MVIVIVGSRKSMLWGLFSGPILGLETIVIGQPEDSMVSNGLNVFEDQWMDQINYFKGRWIQDEDRFEEVINSIEGPKVVIGIGSHRPTDFVVSPSNFMEETTQLSEIIGIIYNSLPNKAPLSSIPHSTSTVKNF
jgi:hypothetical protein